MSNVCDIDQSVYKTLGPSRNWPSKPIATVALSWQLKVLNC